MNKRFDYMIMIALIVISLTAGCAAEPKNLVVLLPSPDGHIGEVLVSGQSGGKKLNKAFEATGSDKAGEPLSEPFVMEEKKVGKIFHAALSSQPAAPIVFLLYFGPFSSVLTDESVKILPDIMAQIRESGSTYVGIVGHSDRVGNKEMNLKLSTERAKVVFEQMVRLGANPTIFEITSHGMENPLIDTPEGVAEPKNRRVEITVR